MIGDNVKKIREEKGLTIEKLAYKAEISARTVNRIEHNKDFRLSNLQKIANALNVSIEEILKK